MEKINFVQDTDKAISVMQNVSSWMQKNGMPLSQWWLPENMNREFLLKHTEPDEYFVAVVGDKPAASVILQDSERNQSWKPIDGDDPKKALYVHWLCVAREFSGQGLSKVMIDFAAKEAKKRGFMLLRLDTDASKKKLRKLYEDLGFQLMGTDQEDEEYTTAFYQKEI